jgi:hypothetical protein
MILFAELDEDSQNSWFVNVDVNLTKIAALHKIFQKSFQLPELGVCRPDWAEYIPLVFIKLKVQGLDLFILYHRTDTAVRYSIQERRILQIADLLVRHVWNLDFDPNTNFGEVYINYLRKKIDKDFDTKLIQTRPGYGYVLREDLKI